MNGPKNPPLPGLGAPLRAAARAAPRPTASPPADPVAQARAAFARGDLASTLRILDAARSSHAGNPEVWRLWAVALFRAKRYRHAVAAFDEACARHPDHLPTVISFGDAALTMGRADRAIEIFGHALTLDPSHRAAAYGRADAARVLHRYREAAEGYRALLADGAEEPRALVGLGASLEGVGDLEAALAAFGRALDLGPADPAATRADIAALLIRLGRVGDAFEPIDAVLRDDPGNRRALSLKVVALGRSGNVDAARRLMGIDTLVALKALPLPEGYADIDAFNRDLVAAVEAHPTLAAPRPEMPMSHGRKTGNLSPGDAPVLDALRAALTQALETHVAAVRQDGHPYLDAMPAKWRFSLWANILSRQGEIGAHIHPAAWFSGAYYAEMPDGPSDPVAKPGWIEIGRPKDALAGDDWPITRFLESKVGHLALFPSYLYHRTVPFSGRGQRVSFGFDVIPL